MVNICVLFWDISEAFNRFLTKNFYIDRLAWCLMINHRQGAQWLSGRVLDLSPKGPRFELRRLEPGVLVLEQDTFILA